MENLKQQIQLLLDQDLMLDAKLKQKVLTALPELNETQVKNILATLQHLVEEETTILAHAVEENPNFFHELQHKILKIMHQEFIKKEVVTQEKAEKQLKTDLSTL